MAKLKIKKIEIAAAVSECESIVRLLQRRGVVEISEPDSYENLEPNDVSEALAESERRIQTVSAASEILSKYAPKVGLLSSLNGRTEISDDVYNSMAAKKDEIYALAKKAVKLKGDVTDANVSKARLKTQIDSLSSWLGLDIPMNFSGTKKTAVFIGTFPRKTEREELLVSLASALPDVTAVDAQIISSDEKQSCAVILCARENRSDVEQAIRSLGFSFVSDPSELTPKAETEKLEREIEACEKSAEDALEKIRETAKRKNEVDFLLDYLTIEKDKNLALQNIVHSKKIFLLSGYAPEQRAQKLKEDIEKKYCAAVVISEPGDDDDVPVVLKNNGFARPVEGITEMYSLPGKDDVDPTPIMAFFYYFFFGMMLSDAGYGLIIAIVTGIVMLKFKLEDKTRNNLKMYFFCGLSTVFWGAMYGSWFGDMPNIIGSNFFHTDKLESIAIWMDPIDQLMELLVYCFIFGLVHLFVGVGIKAYNLWRHGKRLDALCESIPTAVTIFGFCPIFFGLFTDVPEWLGTVGTPALIVGVILVIATAGRSSKSIVGKIGGGLYGLYNLVSGYLGDVLSYARLLALGLSTGVIAQVVNMLCTLPSNNVLKVIMLIVVGAIGHIANLAINLIGAYVHTNRLQYVEFFSKFYEGGGRALRPLRINTKTYKFKEEN